MMRFVGLFGVVALLALTGCEDKPAGPIEPKVTRPLNEVKAMREISGRWQSREDALPGQKRRYVIMDVTSKGDVTIELRTDGGKLPIVLDSIQGKVTASDNFTKFEGKVESPPVALSMFRNFSFGPPKAGILRVNTPDLALDMQYKGL